MIHGDYRRLGENIPEPTVQRAVLEYLETVGPCTLHDLRATGVRRESLHNALDRLVRKKVVRREKIPVLEVRRGPKANGVFLYSLVEAE